MTSQEIFYIIASVALGALLLFLIIAMAFIYTLSRKITQVSRGLSLLHGEVRGMLRSGKSYGKYMGASMGATVLGKILRALRK
jgi:hypothetical protein